MPRRTNISSGVNRAVAALSRGPSWIDDEIALAWRIAQDQAAGAYCAWSAQPGPDGYATYRAAQDRADAAQDALAAERSG